MRKSYLSEFERISSSEERTDHWIKILIYQDLFIYYWKELRLFTGETSTNKAQNLE